MHNANSIIWQSREPAQSYCVEKVACIQKSDSLQRILLFYHYHGYLLEYITLFAIQNNQQVTLLPQLWTKHLFSTSTNKEHQHDAANLLPLFQTMNKLPDSAV